MERKLSRDIVPPDFNGSFPKARKRIGFKCGQSEVRPQGRECCERSLGSDCRGFSLFGEFFAVGPENKGRMKIAGRAVSERLLQLNLPRSAC